MKRGAIIVAGIVVILGGYVVASPFVTMYLMRSAAEARDGEALAEYVDFVQLRGNLKDQFNIFVAKNAAKKADIDPSALMRGALMTVVVEGLVDRFVTPSGLVQIMKGKNPVHSSGPSNGGDSVSRPFEGADFGYLAWDRFVVKAPNNQGKKTRFVLRRNGLATWRLTNIILPLED